LEGVVFLLGTAIAQPVLYIQNSGYQHDAINGFQNPDNSCSKKESPHSQQQVARERAAITNFPCVASILLLYLGDISNSV
jgi:hypothetical protein